MSIGERAARAIRERARITGNIEDELNAMGISHTTFRNWTQYNLNPSAYFLQQMALRGYDIYYILTGERLV